MSTVLLCKFFCQNSVCLLFYYTKHLKYKFFNSSLHSHVPNYTSPFIISYYSVYSVKTTITMRTYVLGYYYIVTCLLPYCTYPFMVLEYSAYSAWHASVKSTTLDDYITIAVTMFVILIGLIPNHTISVLCKSTIINCLI